jgi:hypothetical protein
MLKTLHSSTDNATKIHASPFFIDPKHTAGDGRRQSKQLVGAGG